MTDDAKAPRPPYGQSKDGRSDLKQVLLSLGGSSDGGLPLRMGLRDGTTSDGVDVPQAMEERLALGLDGVKGIVADSTAYSQRPLGVCRVHQVGLVTLVPRPCGMRQEVESWGQQHVSLPLLLDKPAQRRGDSPRRWYGRRVHRDVEVAYGDGRIDSASRRFVAVDSTQLAEQHAHGHDPAQAREAAALAKHIAQAQGRQFACESDAAGAIADMVRAGCKASGARRETVAISGGAVSGGRPVAAHKTSRAGAAAQG